MKKYSAVDRVLSSGPDGIISRVTSGLRALEACGYIERTPYDKGLKLWRTTDKWREKYEVQECIPK